MSSEAFYKICFQNEHFIIVDKEAQVLSVPSRDRDDERPILGKILEADLKTQIYPVHRLDFEVSGLIMFALTPAAQKAGNAWFEKKEVHKTYSALSSSAEKRPHSFKKGEKLTWKCKLLRGKKRAYESPHGKDSLTEALLVDEKNGILKWELSPITGRSHQLRYELFRHDQPILHDLLYGATPESSTQYPGRGIALRSFRIDFSRAPKAREFLLPEKIEIETFNLL